MLLWIVMSLGFLAGFSMGFFNKKVDFYTPILPTLSKKEKALHKRKKVQGIIVFGFLVLALAVVFIVLVWITETVNLSALKDYILGFLFAILPGLFVGMFVTWIIERFSS